MASLKVGVIGCGSIAQMCHLPGYQKNPETEVVAVADPSAERLNEVQANFGIETVYDKPMELLAHPDLDAVSICTPNNTHATYAMEAAKRNLHLLLEKPVTTNLRDAQAIKQAVETAGVTCMVNFTHRFFEGNIAAKAALDRGEIGEVKMFRIRLSHAGPYPGWAKSDWFYDPEQAGGGVLIDMGIHALDLTEFYLGPITNIFCRTGRMVKDVPVEDTATLVVDVDGESYGMIDVSWNTEACFNGVELYGTDGSIIVDYASGVRVCHAIKGTPEAPLEWRRLDINPTAGGWGRIVDVFVEHIHRATDPEADIEAGLVALRVALSAYESVRTGRRISC